MLCSFFWVCRFQVSAGPGHWMRRGRALWVQKWPWRKGAYKGSASKLLRDPRFVRGLRRSTAGMPDWLTTLSGPSGRNRLYSEANRKVIVATVCDPTDCEGSRAYIGFLPAKGLWGASVYLGRHVTELGRPIMPGSAMQIAPDEVSYAITCAQNLDWGD